MPDERVLDLAKSVYELCGQYPDLVDTMKELGFKEISAPGMLATAGRFMTIPKGAAMKRIELGAILAKLKEKGYAIQGGFEHE